MNLAEALGRGLIAEAIAEQRRPGPTLEQSKRAGSVSVRVHYAELPSAPRDVSAQRERQRRHYGNRGTGIPDQDGSCAVRICMAIREAGRSLYWREIEDLADIAKGSLGPVVRKLIASGTLTRTGRPRHYLYGLPGMD